MNNQFTIGDLVKFIIANRNKGCRTFYESSIKSLSIMVEEYSKDNRIAFATNNDNKIVGVVCVKPFHDEKTLFVENIICKEKWVLKNFIQRMIRLYPNYTILSEKRNKFRIHNTPKLINKILCQVQAQ